MKKTLKGAMLLALILISGFLASCSGGSESSSTHNWSKDESVITEEVITETILHEEIIR